MQKQTPFLSKFKMQHLVALCCGMLFFAVSNATAAVVQRGTQTSARPTVSRPTTAGRLPATVTTTVTDAVVAEPEPTEPEAPVEETIIIENKSSQFDSILGASSGSTDFAADERAALIRAQRAALDAADNIAVSTQRITSAQSAGYNACDTALRTCMGEKCAKDFSKCAGDGDTIWGDKLNSCRRDTNCTSEEFTLFAREIKADRDFNATMASYQEVITCGNDYNDCIFRECGTDLSKCVGKKNADAATAACASFARNCQSIDSGLTARTGQVFATLRNNAQVQVRQYEEELYAMREQMRSVCSRMGAMFDERSLDCVYTINLYANNVATPFASKKAYAGSSFDCTPNWFGVDITTYRENAYRLTREQTSATNAMLGSGVGTAVGAISSGAINRAIDTHKAERAVKKAEQQHETDFGDTKKSESTGEPESNTNVNSETEQTKTPPLPISDQQKRCELGGGIWSTATCICKNGGKWNITTGMCEAAPKLNFDSTTTPTSLTQNNSGFNMAAPKLNVTQSGPLSNNTSGTFSERLKAAADTSNVSLSTRPSSTTK